MAMNLILMIQMLTSEEELFSSDFLVRGGEMPLKISRKLKLKQIYSK